MFALVVPLMVFVEATVIELARGIVDNSHVTLALVSDKYPYDVVKLNLTVIDFVPSALCATFPV